MKNSIHFINHASYAIETEETLIIVDPWVQGYAFDNGWALLDQSTSNEQLVSFLKSSGKNIAIWYSHEHSDHFSVPFLVSLRDSGLSATVYFQKTLDGRVASFIRKFGFTVVENNGEKNTIDKTLSLVTCPYESGDSYCLMLIDDFAILNLNDCVVTTKDEAQVVLDQCMEFCSKVDVLMTQFGYANWVGNVSEVELRKKQAERNVIRMKNQVAAFRPKHIIPFASFISFCHEENFYMNDAQNSPKKIYEHKESVAFRDRLVVMKPWDRVEIESEGLVIDGHHDTPSRITHWESCLASAKAETKQSKSFTLDELSDAYLEMRKKNFAAFLVLPQILELLRFIKSTKVYLDDLDVVLSLSYLHGLKITTDEKQLADIEMSSETFMFVVKHEYGENTTHVNGKFQTLNKSGGLTFFRHFSPQSYRKNGWGLSHPILSLKVLVPKAMGKVFARFSIPKA